MQLKVEYKELPYSAEKNDIDALRALKRMTRYIDVSYEDLLPANVVLLKSELLKGLPDLLADTSSRDIECSVVFSQRGFEIFRSTQILVREKR